MDVFRQVLQVLCVLLVLGAAVWMLRRGGAWKGTSNKGRSLESIEKLVLTPHHTLHLIRMEGREIVVATHPQGCTFLRSKVILSTPMEHKATA